MLRAHSLPRTESSQARRPSAHRRETLGEVVNGETQGMLVLTPGKGWTPEISVRPERFDGRAGISRQ